MYSNSPEALTRLALGSSPSPVLDHKTHLAGMVAKRERVENTIFRLLDHKTHLRAWSLLEIKPKLPSPDVGRRVGDEGRQNIDF
jgi:hypothetical protein